MRLKSMLKPLYNTEHYDSFGNNIFKNGSRKYRDYTEND